MGGVDSFIAPSEPSILEVYLIELTSVHHVAKAGDAAMVDVPLILVTGMVNLVEISKRKPLGPSRRLLSKKLREEGVLL